MLCTVTICLSHSLVRFHSFALCLSVISTFCRHHFTLVAAKAYTYSYSNIYACNDVRAKNSTQNLKMSQLDLFTVHNTLYFVHVIVCEVYIYRHTSFLLVLPNYKSPFQRQTRWLPHSHTSTPATAYDTLGKMAWWINCKFYENKWVCNSNAHTHMFRIQNGTKSNRNK